MMSDLIDRLAAIDAVSAVCQDNRAISFITAIKEVPSTQPKVICCKDCKWFGDIGCAIRIVDDSDKPTENDFCSFAERREE